MQGIPVYDVRTIAAGDTIQIGATGPQLSVDHVDDTTIHVAYTQTGNTSVPKSSRLLVISQPAATYVDPYGSTATSPASTVGADGTGRVGFYSTAERVDCLATGSGFTNRIFAEVEAGHRSVDTSRLNASDFPSIQAAIDSLPIGVGGTVMIPKGTYSLWDPLYFPCDRPCHLIGETAGALPTQDGGYQTGTVLRWQSNAGMIRMRGDGSSLQDLTLFCDSETGASAENSGYGVMIGRRDVVDAHSMPGDEPGQTEYERAGSTVFKNARLENVIIHSASGWGLYVPGVGNQSDYTLDGSGDPVPEADAIPPSGTEQGTISIWISCDRVQITSARTYGACFVGAENTTLWFNECEFLRQGNQGNMTAPISAAEFYAHIDACSLVVFDKCTIEGSSPTATTSRPWMRFRGTQNAALRDCWFENDPQFDEWGASSDYDPTYFVQVETGSQAFEMEACRMTRAGRNKGYLRLLQMGEYIQDTTIGSLFAYSSSKLFEFVSSLPKPIDSLAIDLGGNTNVGFRITGTHTVQTGQSEDDGHGRFRTTFPIAIANLPRIGAMMSEQFDTLPGAVDSELYNVDPALAFNWTRQPGNGAVAMNWDLAGDGSAIGTAMLFWTGSGWRLLNAAPVMTSSQRDVRDAASPRWAVGDVIFNSDFHVPEVRFTLTGTHVWRFVNAAPNFIGTSIPSRTFSDGEMILKEKAGVTPIVAQLRVFIGGDWYAVDLTKLV